MEAAASSTANPVSKLAWVIPPFKEWPPDLLYQYHERASIKMESGIPEWKAEADAKNETWKRGLPEAPSQI
jgi:hypothetical protein